MSPSTLFAGVIFGSVGLGYLMYGKRQAKLIPLLCGLVLSALPYFISNMVLLIAVGLVVMAVPLFIR